MAMAMASGHVHAWLCRLCGFLCLYLLLNNIKYYRECLRTPAKELYIGTTISAPEIAEIYRQHKSTHHDSSLPSTTNAVISNCLRIFKQSEIVVCLLLLAGDLELNPGPESDFVNCEPNTNINLKIKSRGFVIAHLNVRSLHRKLHRKLDELKLVVKANTKTIDVLTLSETWLI